MAVTVVDAQSSIAPLSSYDTVPSTGLPANTTGSQIPCSQTSSAYQTLCIQDRPSKRASRFSAALTTPAMDYGEDPKTFNPSYKNHTQQSPWPQGNTDYLPLLPVSIRPPTTPPPPKIPYYLWASLPSTASYQQVPISDVRENYDRGEYQRATPSAMQYHLTAVEDDGRSKEYPVEQTPPMHMLTSMPISMPIPPTEQAVNLNSTPVEVLFCRNITKMK